MSSDEQPEAVGELLEPKEPKLGSAEIDSPEVAKPVCNDNLQGNFVAVTHAECSTARNETTAVSQNSIETNRVESINTESSTGAQTEDSPEPSPVSNTHPRQKPEQLPLYQEETFPRFTSLPPQIRQMIWKDLHAPPTPNPHIPHLQRNTPLCTNRLSLPPPHLP